MPYPPRRFNFRLIDAFREAAAAGDVATDGPPHIPGGRLKSSKRPHSNGTVAAVRRLVEETTLTHRQITAKTGVSHNSISNWTRDFGWKRPVFAAIANDKRRTRRARHKLAQRMLGNRLHALAERCTHELETNTPVDFDRLVEAFQVMKMARLEYMGTPRSRRRPSASSRNDGDEIDRDTAIHTALKEMRRGGVDIDRIPLEAMALLEEAHTPLERDDPALRPRGARQRR